MTKKFCDNCRKELKIVGECFGYDWCGSPLCGVKLTIKASRERYGYPYPSWIPTREQVQKAKEFLKRR